MARLEIVERFRADRRVSQTPQGSPKRPFALIYREWFPAILKVKTVPAVLLLCEAIRQSGLLSVRRDDGWFGLKELDLIGLGLTSRHVRHDAVRCLVALNYFETRRHGQERLEYRLVPGWFKPKAPQQYPDV